MKVSELITFLQTQPQDIHVAYCLHSEQCLLEQDDIELYEACEPRPDGWIHHKRSGKTLQTYLLFPGN